MYNLPKEAFEDVEELINKHNTEGDMIQPALTLP